MELLTSPEAYVSLLTLTAMEVVLGIDNVVFISILTSKLPKDEEPKARNIGLGLALITRLGLLLAISWVMGLTETLFSIASWDVSGRDLILLIGGAFLIAKATHEIHDKLEGTAEDGTKRKTQSFGVIIAQIIVLDIVFSLDSVITAVGMAKHIPVMVAAMVIAVIVMLIFAGSVSRFVNEHPSMKILALSFLLLIGVMLVAEGTGQHIGKGYIYAAMAFSLFVEVLNMRRRKKSERYAPVKLHQRVEEEA